MGVAGSPVTSRRGVKQQHRRITNRLPAAHLDAAALQHAGDAVLARSYQPAEQLSRPPLALRDYTPQPAVCGLFQARQLFAEFFECGGVIAQALFFLFQHGGRHFGDESFVGQFGPDLDELAL